MNTYKANMLYGKLIICALINYMRTHAPNIDSKYDSSR